jgi:N-acetylglucosaminyldiphosphoundecaprenol N-acetyl-beta-D-mannosaminyltransferase
MKIDVTRGRGDAGTRRTEGGKDSQAGAINHHEYLQPRPVPASQITGIFVDNLSEDEALAAIDRMMGEGGPHYMTVVNAAKLVAASRDAELRRAIAAADLVTADGMSVVWASRLLGNPLKERVTGIDMFARLVAHAARAGLSVYFLGASEESVRGVVERFTREHAGLRVAGFRNGYFDRSEAAAVADQIKLSRADMLFVAMGSPAQEFWIAENLERAGVSFALGVGGSFDHLSGHARRAPRWMQRWGLEWFYRLLREPRRLWRRYLVGNSRFILLVAKQRLKGRP